MFATANGAQEFHRFGQVPSQFRIGELLAHFHFVEPLHEAVGEVPDEFPVLAIVGGLYEMAPQWISYDENLIVSFFNDAHKQFSFSGSGGLFWGQQKRSTCIHVDLF